MDYLLPLLAEQLRRKLNVDSPSWHVEVKSEPIVQAVMEFAVPYAEVAIAADRRRLVGRLARTCCRNGMRRPLDVAVRHDGVKFLVQVCEREYRKRGAATAIAELLREFREASP